MNEEQKNEQAPTAEKRKSQKAEMGGIVGGAAGGAALAGAGAMVYNNATGEEFAQFETADGNVVSIWADTDNDGVYDTEFQAIPVSEQEQQEEVVAADPIPINGEGQSFSETFAEARSEQGAGGVFEFNGQSFNTFYPEELQDMSEDQINQWASLPDGEKLEYYSSIDDSEMDVPNDSNDQIAMVDDDIENIDDNENFDNNEASDWELV